jgi:uncharacterized protein YqeY
MPETVLDQVQADTREAMKAGERERVGALRMLASSLQQEAKEGGGDELVDAAIRETGASGPGDMGKVMGAVMPKVDGRADGKRVSDAVRARLGGER